MKRNTKIYSITLDEQIAKAYKRYLASQGSTFSGRIKALILADMSRNNVVIEKKN